MPEVTITEAARLLGLSTDSIRRRISKGDLKSRKVASSHGEMYMVEIPDDTPAVGESPQTALTNNNAEVEALRQTISILETELEARRREISELHILLQRASLPAPRVERIPWWRRLFPPPHKQS